MCASASPCKSQDELTTTNPHPSLPSLSYLLLSQDALGEGQERSAEISPAPCSSTPKPHAADHTCAPVWPEWSVCEDDYTG